MGYQSGSIEMLKHKEYPTQKINLYMRLYSTIWSADWATRGGIVKTDWSNAPFTASYRRYGADACVSTNGQSFCSSSRAKWWDQVLAADCEKQLKDIQNTYMIYNYCNDIKRFPKGQPPECSLAY
ncbi:Xyloglucan endotransglucosylase/hydrolase [Thalictrum thalictroides]|uniref:Xyloglucan endotransglucosylase/hydrolase n=1 Tax=Thalictrum thalictroides TaxID=46969 RepID=A0A7J6XAC6_THATH|nr:Xyloglucan endotransglucosylase/hydrolase [Thalictrum thalictroides]